MRQEAQRHFRRWAFFVWWQCFAPRLCPRGEERKKKPRKLAKSDRFPLIEQELHKGTKVELVAMILAIAKEHAVVARKSEDRLTIEKPVDLLVAGVSPAIDRATDFDERLVYACNQADERRQLSTRMQRRRIDDPRYQPVPEAGNSCCQGR